MKNLFLGLILAFLMIQQSEAQEEIGTESSPLIAPTMMVVPGTNTPPATNTMPYITALKITPKQATMTVGQSILFSATVLWSDGLQYPYTTTYTCNQGSITTHKNSAVYTTTKPGIVIVKAQVEGFEDSGRIIVSPDKLEKIALSYSGSIFYGTLYLKEYFNFKGYDKYDNELVINKVEYKIRKKTATHLSEWMGETMNPDLNAIIKTGAIFNHHILFFDVGDYEMQVIIDGQSTIFPITVKFDGYDTPVVRDYRIVDIDFDKGEFAVEYLFAGTPAIRSNFIVKDEWIKQFKEGGITERIQVLAWLHYRILFERTKVLKEVEYEQFKNLLIKMLEGKF